MGIANVLRTLGFVTSETEPLASEVYSQAGQANLTFTTGYIQGMIRNLRATTQLNDAELKKLITLATLASSLAANAAALAEAGIPASALTIVVNDVLQWVDEKQKEKKKNNPSNMN